jgi:hypothetical protein
MEERAGRTRCTQKESTTAGKTHGVAYSTPQAANVVLRHRELDPKHHTAAMTSIVDASQSLREHSRRTREFVSGTPLRSPVAKQYPKAPGNTSRQGSTTHMPPKVPTPSRTEAGRQAHRAQQADWMKTQGMGAFVTESTPYPLRPGTLPVGSGECFTCGFTGHMGRRDGSTCGGNRPLHQHEQTWRAISSRILRQTKNVANIQLVMVDDYGTTWQEVQGNGDGPSN